MQMLRLIDRWAEENPEQAQFIRDAFWERLSLPEQSFQEQYGVTWHYSFLEWLPDAHELKRIEDTVDILDNLLLLGNPCNSLIGIEPFPAILEKLGASVTTVIPRYYQSSLCVDIICTMPNHAVAHYIYRTLTEHAAGSIPPWLLYWGGQFQPLSEETLAALSQAIAYEAYLDSLSESLAGYTHWRHDAWGPAWIAWLRETHMVPIQRTEHEHAWWRLHAVQFEIEPSAISLEGQGLLLSGVDFSKHSLPQGLPALVAWLRAQECRVEYTFRRKF